MPARREPVQAEAVQPVRREACKKNKRSLQLFIIYWYNGGKTKEERGNYERRIYAKTVDYALALLDAAVFKGCGGRSDRGNYQINFRYRICRHLISDL